MRELHLFAGAGGGILGGILLGHTTVCAVEIEPYCRQVLLQRQRDGILPKFPIWDDVRTFDGTPWRGLVDVVCGGFPCQSFSNAASGRNNADDLWPEARRIIADIAPWYVFAENVSKRAIEAAADDCALMGYKTRMVAVSAQDMGADHQRKRFWLGAYADHESQLHRSINAEMAVLASVRPRIWETISFDPRMVDGVADRMERYAATGNGQIPSVAALAWRTLFPR